VTDAAVADDIRRARVVYGGFLVGEGITVVACSERPDDRLGNRESGPPTAASDDPLAAASDGDAAGVGLLTAVAAARSDLEQYLGETEDELSTDLGAIAAPHLDGATPVVTARDRAAALAVRSRAVYLQTETAGRGWIRVRDATPSAFPDGEPFAGILALSTTVAADARDRIAAQPPVVRDRLTAALDETEL
jgi:hypothetical protein